MLAIRRKVDEAIEFNGPGRIHVVRASEGSVVLGFEGPRSTKVLRNELVRQVNNDVQLYWQCEVRH